MATHKKSYNLPDQTVDDIKWLQGVSQDSETDVIRTAVKTLRRLHDIGGKKKTVVVHGEEEKLSREYLLLL